MIVVIEKITSFRSQPSSGPDFSSAGRTSSFSVRLEASGSFYEYGNEHLGSIKREKEFIYQLRDYGLFREITFLPLIYGAA